MPCGAVFQGSKSKRNVTILYSS
ncbi:hypothetical protein STPYR_12629 [uncultured Stenotrophomonas sp.]|uniref:Uncharacterized protein n=1 Tax=uncultured Stenotrophomonas sp. TaxID=165438 RepID=A0A1Y5Q8T0_9GAMM|nr:hypothetical protein STPYR_12629 [uncultured Stenotrophomonas sp.]